MQRTPAQRVHGRAPRGVVDLAADHLGAGPRPPRSSERFELVESSTLGRADAKMESTAGEACSLGQQIGVSGLHRASAGFWVRWEERWELRKPSSRLAL